MNPSTEAADLLERIRRPAPPNAAESAGAHPSPESGAEGLSPANGADLPPLPALPGFAAFAPPSPVPLAEAASMIPRAREKTTVGSGAPGFLRPMLRNQGGFNGIVVETCDRLVEAGRQLEQENARLRERVDALTQFVTDQSVWLDAFVRRHAADRQAQTEAHRVQGDSVKACLEGAEARLARLTAQGEDHAVALARLETQGEHHLNWMLNLQAHADEQASRDAELESRAARRAREGDEQLIRRIEEERDHLALRIEEERDHLALRIEEERDHLARRADEGRDQLGQLQAQHAQHARASDLRLDQMGAHVNGLQAQSDRQNEHLQGVHNHLDRLGEHVDRLGEHVGRIEERVTRTGEHLGGLQAEADRQGTHLRDLQAHADRVGEHLGSLRADHDRRDAHLRDLQAHAERMGSFPADNDRQDAHLRDLQAHADRLAAHLGSLQSHNDRQSERVDSLHRRLDQTVELCDHARDEMNRATSHQRLLEEGSRRLDERQINDASYLRAQLTFQQRLIAQWLAPATPGPASGGAHPSPPSLEDISLPPGSAEAVANSGGPEPPPRRQAASLFSAHEMDALYLAFEDAMRGSRGQIKERVGFYLPYLTDAGVGNASSPVLDLGCGRGEWLEVLRENGLAASGVDLNVCMIDQCHERGLEAKLANVIDHLAALPDASCGALTAFHLIEHLPFQVLVKFLGECRRVLQPGGVAIFETPNPTNLIVGACSFYYDYTHQRPLPPDSTRFLVEHVGFARAEIVPLHPWNEADRVHGDGTNPSLVARFNDLVYGPQDYAIVARTGGRTKK